MKSAKCVIDANFGDSGKGSLVNYLSNKDTTVVKINGGANSGHTVCMPDGRRHVFGHIGSGTFKGAGTHLSRFFISNPLLFQKEYDKLAPVMTISIDPRSIITTHYDMLINQVVENYRTNKHGSCGVGINETIHRNKVIPINFESLTVRSTIKNYLLYIRSSYLNKRLIELKVPEEYIVDNKAFSEAVLDNLDEAFIDATFFMKQVVSRLDDEYVVESRNIVFEGAQGLLLDQDSKYFPHVTHSKTGLDNVLEFIKDSSVKHLDVYYCTRPYLTRHGNGPLPNEVSSEVFNIKDETNITNKYQGSLRFAYLDINELQDNIYKEHTKIPSNISSTRNIVVSCLDQVPEQWDVIMRGNKRKTDINTIFNFFDKKILSYSKYGPTNEV